MARVTGQPLLHAHHLPSAGLCTDQVGHGDGLPAEPPQALEENEDFLKKAHHVLLEVGENCLLVSLCVITCP